MIRIRCLNFVSDSVWHFKSAHSESGWVGAIYLLYLPHHHHHHRLHHHRGKWTPILLFSTNLHAMVSRHVGATRVDLSSGNLPEHKIVADIADWVYHFVATQIANQVRIVDCSMCPWRTTEKNSKIQQFERWICSDCGFPSLAKTKSIDEPTWHRARDTSDFVRRRWHWSFTNWKINLPLIRMNVCLHWNLPTRSPMNDTHGANVRSYVRIRTSTIESIKRYYYICYCYHRCRSYYIVQMAFNRFSYMPILYPLPPPQHCTRDGYFR